MPIEFRLPPLGDNVHEAEVSEVLVEEGDEVDADQVVVELETEKAVIEIPCPHSGRIRTLHVAKGETIEVGSLVLTILGVAEDPPLQLTCESDVTDSETGSNSHSTSSAGPEIRDLAQQFGVDLHQVTGTGVDGEIIRADVEAYVRCRLAEIGDPEKGPISPPLPDFTQFGPVERQRLSNLNRTAAERLTLSWQVIPHVTQHELADITQLDSARREFMETAGKQGPKITLTAIALKACSQLLIEMPRFNSSLDTVTNELVLKHYVHIGVAIDTEFGLVVPVIKNVNQKSTPDIASELAGLAARARRRELDLAEMKGATFTVTNIGGIGGTSATPIVNYPEVAILGLSRAHQQAAIVDDRVQARLMLPLSLSYDHRVLNGADVARFLVRLKELLGGRHGLA